MLANLTSLEETAQRFYKSTEFIWNLSLQYNDVLKPDLGDNGLVAYSERQRQAIGRILQLREQGMNDSEIAQQFNAADPCDKPVVAEPASCRCSEQCSKNFKILTNQVKHLYKQLCRLQSEFDEMQRSRAAQNETATAERVFPVA